jgi:hypothetical protein
MTAALSHPRLLEKGDDALLRIVPISGEFYLRSLASCQMSSELCDVARPGPAHGAQKRQERT